MQDPRVPAGEALATRTAVLPLSVSAPPSPPACLAPPAKFGRAAHAARDLDAKVSAGWLSGHPATSRQAGYRPRTLCVVVDDPAAAALALGNQMKPADLMELVLILAEAAADVLGKRKQMH